MELGKISTKYAFTYCGSAAVWRVEIDRIRDFATFSRKYVG